MIKAILSTAVAAPSYDLRMTLFTGPAATPAISVDPKDLHFSLVSSHTRCTASNMKRNTEARGILSVQANAKFSPTCRYCQRQPSSPRPSSAEHRALSIPLVLIRPPYLSPGLLCRYVANLSASPIVACPSSVVLGRRAARSSLRTTSDCSAHTSGLLGSPHSVGKASRSSCAHPAAAVFEQHVRSTSAWVADREEALSILSFDQMPSDFQGMSGTSRSLPDPKLS